MVLRIWGYFFQVPGYAMCVAIGFRVLRWGLGSAFRVQGLGFRGGFMQLFTSGFLLHKFRGLP